MRSGTCAIVIDGSEAGQVEYKYNDNGRGELLIEPEVLMDAFGSRNVGLLMGEEVRSIIIESATPGAPAQFSFSEWRKQR